MRKTALCMFMLLVALSGKQPPSHLVRPANGFKGGNSESLLLDSILFLSPKVAALWFWRKTPHKVRTDTITNQSHPYTKSILYTVVCQYMKLQRLHYHNPSGQFKSEW